MTSPRNAPRDGEFPATLTVRPRPVVRALLATALLLSAAHFVGVALWGLRLSTALNINLEPTVATWFSCGVHLFNSALLVLIAAGAPPVDRWRWRVLAASVLFVSADEISGLHERADGVLHQAFDTSGIFAYAWTVPAALAVLIVGVSCGRVALRRPGGPTVAVGAVVFVLGAVGTEAVGGWWTEGHGHVNVAYLLITGVEETLEMLGAVIATSGLLRIATGSTVAVGGTSEDASPATSPRHAAPRHATDHP